MIQPFYFQYICALMKRTTTPSLHRLMMLMVATCLSAAVSHSCRGPVSANPATAKKKALTAADSSDLIRKAWQVIDSIRSQLKDGDLVTRSDNDYESRILQNFSNGDKSYSHSGLVFREAEGWVVYHAMTGAENPAGTCRRDPLDSFAHPGEKNALGLFRYSLQPDEISRLHQYVQEVHQKNIPFDVTFNLNSNDSLYCSELIWKGLRISTRERVVLPTNLLYNFRPKIMGYKYNQVLLKKFEYVSIDNLYLNPFCTEIRRVNYFND